MIHLADVLAASRSELQALLDGGHPVELRQLDGVFRGISLGLPGWLERLTWKKFAKVFVREPSTGEVRGWNMRVEQDGLDRPWRPRIRNGTPWTFGPFAVLEEHGRTLLDYGAASSSRLDPLRCVRDPLVSLRGGSVELLLGRSDLAVGRARLATPSYFVLQPDPGA